MYSALNQLLPQTQVDLEQLKIPESAFTPATLREFDLTPINPTVQESSNFQLTFHSMNSLSVNATIVIDFTYSTPQYYVRWYTLEYSLLSKNYGMSCKPAG